jgi:hypothetical protein
MYRNITYVYRHCKDENGKLVENSPANIPWYQFPQRKCVEDEKHILNQGCGRCNECKECGGWGDCSNCGQEGSCDQCQEAKTARRKQIVEGMRKERK